MVPGLVLKVRSGCGVKKEIKKGQAWLARHLIGVMTQVRGDVGSDKGEAMGTQGKVGR